MKFFATVTSPPAYLGSLKGGESHIVLGGVGPGGNDLRRGVTRGGIFQLVLYRFEKILGDWAFVVIVHREGENLFDFLIDPLFAGPDIPNTLQQLVKVVRTKFPGLRSRSSLSGKALLHILGQHPAGPAAEVYANTTPHSVANGQDHIQAIKLGVPPDSPATLGLNL